jgi:LacI family transcriptional regulator
VATIKDVARVAKVSTATVSRVVHGLDRVSDKTKNKVNKVIAELGYRPNINARALKNRRSDTIGMVTPNLSAVFFGTMASGIEEAARKANYKVMMSNSLYETATEIEAIESLRENGCENIILHSDFSDDETLIRLANEVPGLVIINRFIKQIAHRCVWVDNVAGGRVTAEYLLEMGHSKIAIVSSEFKNRDPMDREKGIQQVLSLENTKVSETLIKRVIPNIQGGYDAAVSLVESGEEFSAILVYNDIMSIGVMNALHDAGKKVPEDVSVIGFDDIFIAQASRPALTTMHYPIEEMAMYAVRLSMALTDNTTTPTAKTHLFMADLVERNSVVKRN